MKRCHRNPCRKRQNASNSVWIRFSCAFVKTRRHARCVLQHSQMPSPVFLYIVYIDDRRMLPDNNFFQSMHLLNAYFIYPSTRTANWIVYIINGPDDDTFVYFPTSMSSALSNILITHDVKTSGDLAISLKRVPWGIARRAFSFSRSTTGTSVMMSVKSAGRQFPDSNRHASTISCKDLVFKPESRPGSPFAKKSKMRGIRM